MGYQSLIAEMSDINIL